MERMTFETKHIKGHAEGTNMDWLCIRHLNEGFGFGDDPAITCVDMSVHAPEHNKPQVLFSTYQNPEINIEQMKYKFQPNAPRTWEQIAFGKFIISNWDEIQNYDLIEINQDDTRKIDYQIKKQWKWEKKK